MTRLSIDLPDDDAAPAHLTFSTDEELEVLLVRRVNDLRQGIEATPQFWEDFKQRIEARRCKGA
jgi:hypothetical protein